MTPFRQVILPGAVGADVWAVKRAYLRMGIRGSGSLGRTRRAGPAFVAVTRTVQRQHGLAVDGRYGSRTHAIVAPHFDLYGAALYRSAAIRRHPEPPPPAGSAASLAQRILAHERDGRYHADNPGDRRDLVATAAGRAVWSQHGRYVHLDPRPLRLLLWLIEDHDRRIGTFALCSDHHDDGLHGHAGGLAVDISSIDGVSIGSRGSRSLTLAVASTIRASTILRPRQLICGGYGGLADSTIESLCIPSAAYYGYATVAGHRNHIHAGY